MPILSQTLHQYQDGDRHVAAAIDNGQLVIAATRSDEDAAEGHYGQLVTVISLRDAISIAKAVLASQAQELVDEEARFDAWVEEQAKHREDYHALVDSALEHDIHF